MAKPMIWTAIVLDYLTLYHPLEAKYNLEAFIKHQHHVRVLAIRTKGLFDLCIPFTRGHSTTTLTFKCAGDSHPQATQFTHLLKLEVNCNGNSLHGREQLCVARDVGIIHLVQRNSMLTSIHIWNSMETKTLDLLLQHCPHRVVEFLLQTHLYSAVLLILDSLPVQIKRFELLGPRYGDIQAAGEEMVKSSYAAIDHQYLEEVEFLDFSHLKANFLVPFLNCCSTNLKLLYVPGTHYYQNQAVRNILMRLGVLLERLTTDDLPKGEETPDGNMSKIV